MGLSSYRAYLRKFFFILYEMHIHRYSTCFILEMPVQYFRSPDDIATKKYG